LAVVECRSFSAAARRLYISHSSTSRAIAALENRLGVKLLERDNRVLGLTAAGEALRDEAQKIISAAEEAERRVIAAGREMKKEG